MNASKPILYEGSSITDDRGTISFVNTFDFGSTIRRHYLVSNHQPLTVRAWHAHRYEHKFVAAVQGSALVCAVRVVNWKRPRKDTAVHRFVLSASSPAVLFIPAGYANGWMNLTADCKLLWFSTATVEDSRKDDVRYPSRYWNPWVMAER